MNAEPPSPQVRTRLIKLLWLADSPNDHERSVAVSKFMALLKKHNLTPADVLAPPPIHQVVEMVQAAPAPQQPRTWRDVISDAQAQPEQLSAWELKFLASVGNWRGPLTAKQRTKLTDIAERLGLAVPP